MWYHLFYVVPSLVFLVVYTVRRILSYYGHDYFHPRRQSFVRRGSRVKEGRPDLGWFFERQRPITTWPSAKRVTPATSLPPPHKLKFLGNVNKPWAKYLILKSRQLWKPPFFPGVPTHYSATATRNFSTIPNDPSLPTFGKKDGPMALVLGKEQVPVIQVARKMVVQEPSASWCAFSRDTKRIRQSLETNYINKQMTPAKHPMTFRPSLKPWDTLSKKNEKNVKNQISDVPEIQSVKLTNEFAQMGEALAVPSQGLSTQCLPAEPRSCQSSSCWIKTGASEGTDWSEKGKVLNIPDVRHVDITLPSFTNHQTPLPSTVPIWNTEPINPCMLLSTLTAIAGALQPESGVDAEVLPVSAPRGPVFEAPSSVSSRVKLQARRRLGTSTALQPSPLPAWRPLEGAFHLKSITF